MLGTVGNRSEHMLVTPVIPENCLRARLEQTKPMPESMSAKMHGWLLSA